MRLLLVLRFLAELGMLLCMALGGWALGGSFSVSLLLCVALPVVAALVWGRWVAPRASRRLRDPGRLAVEVVMFAVALLLMLFAGTAPALPVLGLTVSAAFVLSVPSRGHEPAGPLTGPA